MWTEEAVRVWLSDNVTTVLLSTVLGIAVVVYFFRNRNLPPGPYGLPWVGYLPFLGDTPHLKLAELTKSYGDIMSITVMGKTCVHLNTLDLIKEAFVTKSEHFSGRDPAFNLINWIEDGKAITQTEGNLWKEQRHFFLQSIRKFGYGKLSLEGHIHDVMNTLFQLLKDSKETAIDIQIPLSNAASNVICKLLMCSEFRPGDNDFTIIAEGLRKFLEHFIGHRVFLIGPVGKLVFRFLPGYKELEHTKATIHGVVDKIIKQHKQTFDKNHIRDFTDCYLQELQKHEGKKSQETTFSIDNLQANNVNTLMEGTDSVGLTIYRMLRELLKHPEVQQRIQKELDDVTGSQRLPSWADRTNLPYTEAALNELQRITIPFPLAAFHSNPKETTLRGYRIPKRSLVISNLWSVHMDPKLWKEPEKFDPNRFLNADGKCEKKQSPVIFGIGKRSCPGEPLAIMEIFLFITCVLQKFTLKDPGGNDPDNMNYKLVAVPRSF